MAKNACRQQIEWTKNSAYNNNVTANDRYMGEVFGLDPQTLEYRVQRTSAPMVALTDDFGHIEGDVELNDDPIEVVKREFAEHKGATPSFSGNLKKYNAISSIVAYSKI